MIVGWRFKCSASDQNKNDINTIKSYVGLVCGDDMIKKCNDLGYNGMKEIIHKKPRRLVKRFFKADNEKDVNCVTIPFFLAGTNNQEKIYEKLEAFADKGENLSLKIEGIGSL